MSLKRKYHIYMLDPQPHINMTQSETSGKHSNKTHLSLSLLTVKLVLTIWLPSGHGQTGRVGTSNQTINRIICLFPRWSTSFPEALSGQQMCNWEKKTQVNVITFLREKLWGDRGLYSKWHSALRRHKHGKNVRGQMWEGNRGKSCEQTTQLEINTGGKKKKKIISSSLDWWDEHWPVIWLMRDFPPPASARKHKD